MKRLKNLLAGLLLLTVWPAGGLAGDGAVALQSADPSCRDDSSNTYVNCGNGTVTDNRTGLVWLKNADCLGAGSPTGNGLVTWDDAMAFVAGLSDKPATSTAAAHDCGLADGSSPGEWRLPSVEEWEAMVADANGGPRDLDCSPTITNDAGTACWTGFCSNVPPIGCSFAGVASANYWSSTTSVTAAKRAWFVNLNFGNAGILSKDNVNMVWPVRGGQ